ncbi:inorganic diphosphatase activity protein [Coemansia sp. RSA 1813]|nr:Inorganic pyrophosphatase [Coemansia sp. RSA 1646]KAJ1773007.1 inorganic diphosphatase activity protein [Coemansia sp. RSA 1843]KAJ2092217.1 inorganic diphosphatase activity protein [Coemansia sp. RSA 986]KAJ2211335.1 inorganic diphosphatase activity protein [Coemansia sp. RSA 487]KAJ2570310.1 inorganic diphosphatase activity protein [Coemansia sp. RSA 1813]
MFAKRSGFLNTRVQSALAPAIRPKQPCFRRYLNEYIKSVLARPVGIATSRMFFKKDGSLFSPWHDIPLVADATKDEYNMVCEIPRWTNAKLEIDTKAAFNPIRQDTKNGNLRYVSDIFPYKGYIWNYGALPQTFEDPAHVDTDTGYVGDSDPVDVIEIGQAVCAQGCVYRVKVLGVVALIDDGETDWKVIALRSDDPLASKVHSVDCLEKYMPGLLNATIDWFTKYKVPDGKPLNKWAFDGKARDAEYARNIIAGTHHAWKKLVGLQHSKFSM